jgi:hypothetical protein
MLRFIRNPKRIKIISLSLLIIFLQYVFIPTDVFALTSGPTSPEFSSFEPIATTDMVNVFTGDFKYNLPVIEIPGPDGGGYGLSLSYHTGASAEQEASWVGFGWTLNPGSINREVRGFPDDYKETEVIQYKKTRPNWTYSATHAVGNVEIFGADVPLNFNTSYIFNNYTGYSRNYGLGISVKGMAGLNMNVSDEGDLTFSAYVNPLKILGDVWESTKESDNSDNIKNSKNNETQGEKNRKEQLRDIHQKRIKEKLEGKFSVSLASSSYGLFTYSEVVRATSIERFRGDSWNWTTSVGQVNPSMAPIGPEYSISGNLNIQANIPRQIFQSNGYINSPNRSANNNVLSDHYYENDSPYNKRDYNLGIPFNNHDQFIVMGEGLGGSYRYFTKKLGHFYPNFITNKTDIKTGGIEFMLGSNVGIGLDIGFGDQFFSSELWDTQGNTSEYQFDQIQDGFFRFNNDLGGKVEYSSSTNAQSARVNSSSSFPGSKKGKPSIPESIQKLVNVTGSSSFISFKNVQQLRAEIENSSLRLNKNVNIQEVNNYLNNINKITNGETIIEFKTTNESGIIYTYGLPVFNADDLNLQLSLENGCIDCGDVRSSADRNCIEDNYLVYQDLLLTSYDGSNIEPNLEEYETVLGELRKEPYVKNYLLTQITSHDFIDVGNNGPGEEDFGAWTNFYYHQKYNILNSPYHWRSPYNGMQFIKNSISDPRDDLGAVLCGNKDVYYMKAIETKTHIAFFVTNETDRDRFENAFKDITLPSSIDKYIKGSQINRFDGLGAPGNTSNQDLAANSNNVKDINQRLERLEKIVLFSKSNLSKPIKTVHFEYDYSLVKNLSNNVNGQFPQTNINENSGKLTLKKVWFEYEGKYRTRISPYQFEYSYKNFTEDYNYLKSRFEESDQELFEYSNHFSGSIQNPNYEPYILDSWGNVQPNGKERHQDMNPWIYQGTIRELFDPAAWQLKQIKLPSGGEILIQYEQKDYRFVQDRPAMGMMSIKEMPEDNQFYLNLSDFGIDDSNQAEVKELAQKIENYYGSDSEEKEKIYFKFLYSFSENPPDINLNSCNAEYITGYAKVNKVEVEEVPGSFKWRLKITLGSDDSSDGERTTLPRQACLDYYKSQRDGWNSNDCNYKRNVDDDTRVADEADKIENKVVPKDNFTELDIDLADFKLFFRLFGLEAVESITRIGEEINNPTTICREINPRLSYFKIPMINPKRGGGIRVKRLLMFDPGIEQDDAMIYGNEYSYINEDGQSSGIATNEPVNFGSENALISFLPRKGQNWFSRLTTGMDKKQTEGPIGRTLLPSPSVGHSRVEVKNIHSGKTGTGKVVHEFFTAKDYPFDKYYSGENDISSGKGAKGTTLSDNEVNDFLLIPAGIFNMEINNSFLGQGFRFIQNDMHGQPKSKSTYCVNKNGHSYLTTMLEFKYYEPGEKVLILNQGNRYSYTTPGKEEDITLGMRKLANSTTDISVELDVSIGLCFPPPIFITPIPTISLSEKDLSTHVTSKVIAYPAIMKSITNYQEGTYTITEFKAFDQFTGKSILTRTIDGYHKIRFSSGNIHDGSIYKLEIPASYIYPEMRPIFSTSQSDFMNASNYNQLNDKTALFISYGADGFILDTVNGTWHMNNYIEASVQTYAKGSSISTWFDQKIKEPYEIPNSTEILTQLNSIYRPYSNYIYKTPITSANEDNIDSKVYNAGIFTDIQTFNWNNESLNMNNNWIRTIEVTKYSPHGYPLEEKNILGLYSSLRYGENYKYNVPSIRTDNAEYASIAFEDFENTPGSLSHSGKGSMLIENEISSSVILKNLYNTNQLREVGGWLKLWITKVDADLLDPFDGYNNNDPELSISLNNSIEKIPLEYVARSGEWALFKVWITGNHFSALPNDQKFSISLNTDNINKNLNIDDVRFEPYNAMGSCFVYDKETLRLIAQFDNQHFALFYQYDDEGKLTRKLIETERGVKTIQEVHYNTPLKDRN